MICHEATPLLELLADGQLNPGQVSELTNHLDACTECSAAWKEIQTVRQRVGNFIKLIDVPSSLHQQILSELAGETADSQGIAYGDAEQQKPNLKIAPPQMNNQDVGEVREAESSGSASVRSIATPMQFQQSELKEATYNLPVRHAFRPRAVICERHELIRYGLKRVIAEVVDTIGESADGYASIEIIRRLRPDFVMLDVDLDVLNGVEVCRRIGEELSDTNVLVLTDSYHATKYHNQLLRAGARGFCLKSSGPRTLFEAIDQVTHGLPYCDPKIVQLLKQTPAAGTPSTILTDRETEVLIRLDLRNKEISEELDMKLRTVEKHIESILAKLKVPTRTAAALKALQLGYILLPKMPGRDPITGVSHEHTMSELNAELAIANEHLKALIKQNELLKQAIEQRIQAAPPPQQ